MIKSLLVAAIVSSSTFMAVPAIAADFPLIVVPGPGTFTANVSDTALAKSVTKANPLATFTDRFLFTLPQNAISSVSLTTTGKNGSANDIDFVSATLNGNALTLSQSIGALFEKDYADLDGISLVAGVQNILSVTYRSYGKGANFGGTISAIAAVPEPGTWALLIAGFGVVGSALRGSRRARAVLSHA